MGIVGRSGSGKTTVTRLLQRLHSNYDGLIKIDGVDVREYDVDHLRRSLGVVLQESFLFSGTIRENIMVAKSDATFDEVVRAARMAGAEEFIDKLPRGYDTYVYEGSPNLSGGQRQRLAIARALIVDPRILILDEATSALDPESEAIVSNNLARIGRGRTLIVISHRLVIAGRVRCDPGDGARQRCRCRPARGAAEALRYLQRTLVPAKQASVGAAGRTQGLAGRAEPCLLIPQPLPLVRQFQSETDAIREAPEPRWARITVFVLAGLLVSLIAIMVLTRMDRVITSQAGKIVPTQQVNVFQALDTSIIRSIDVREGQRVPEGSAAGDARSDLCGGRRAATEAAVSEPGSTDRPRPRGT